MKNLTSLLAILVALPTMITVGTIYAAENDDGHAASREQSADKLDLPGTSIIGNQELPMGLDIVPWRPAAAGDVKEGPTQLLDEPLEPIDPEVFRHQLQIYSDTRR